MQSLSVSEIQRNLQNLNDFDVLEIVDKKRNVVKGYFLDSRYKALIDELLQKRASNRKNLMGLIGSVSSQEPDQTVDQLRDEHLSKYE
ncbi:hypothetical protein [Leucothrix arctica]|uniref:Uncharacterized protein n=1 Tax=Leucothrix arctica TaxID=1481894 RepID=A0A317CI46_9GAMM|nr:hypothetical protein [Leucothrix arctica]PWQ97083.1 hypothetical protein DKT75_07760 [Leucothrix arctica]